MCEPHVEPEPAVREEDAEVTRARLLLKISELNQEIRRLTEELDAPPRQATPPPLGPWRRDQPRQPIPPQPERNPPETDPEEMPEAQGSPQTLRPHP